MINNKYKTVMCKHFEQTGQCYMGAKCHFAHGSQELRGLNDPLPASPIPGNTPSRQPGSFSGQSPQTGAGNYKTVKCRFFEKGLCKHNQNCSFAHGDQELRQTSKGYSGSQGGGSGSMSMQNMMQPMYDPSLQNQVAFQQIQLLANEMKNYHAKDNDLSAQIKQAIELNSSGNIQGAASILYGLMDRPAKTKQDSDTYNSFSVKMQELGATMYQTFQMQQYTQQMASPQMDYSPMGGYGGMYNQGYSGQGYQKSQEYNGGSYQGQDKGHSGQSYGMNNYNYGGHQGGHQGGHDSHPDNQGQY